MVINDVINNKTHPLATALGYTGMECICGHKLERGEIFGYPRELKEFGCDTGSKWVVCSRCLRRLGVIW